MTLSAPFGPDVLIIGAGPAGLTLACDLQRRGVRYRIVEALAAPITASRGKGLQPRTLEVFHDLGIVDRALAAGRLYPPVQFCVGPDVVREAVMTPYREPGEAEPYPNTLMLPQRKTEALLRDRLAELGGRIDYGCAFRALEQHADAVTAQLDTAAGSEQVAARYVVAADGGRSAVRKALPIAFEGEPPPGGAMLVADILADGLGRDHWRIWASAPECMIGLCPLPSTEAYQVYAALPDDAPAQLSVAGLQALIDARAPGAGVTARAILAQSVYRPNLRMADRFRVDRVFLIGDAAHVHPPTGGQGLNTSVQDAYNLGWKLERALGGDDSLLDSYEDERLPVAAEVLGRSDLLFRRGLGEMRRGADEQQLRLNYRGGPLARDAHDSETLQPGDRMPDAWLRDSTGASVSLFDLMRGPQGTTLTVDADARRATVDGRDYENAGEVLKALAGRTVVIRPDGYVLQVAAAERPKAV